MDNEKLIRSCGLAEFYLGCVDERLPDEGMVRDDFDKAMMMVKMIKWHIRDGEPIDLDLFV